ncbi:MAG: hypothetical protein RMJ98_18255, partial [Myxococcales bacterium]|nr:hypothetical protein [Myxococcales bacterium]
ADNVLAVGQEMVTSGTISAEQLSTIRSYLDARGLLDCGRILSLNKEAREMGQFGLELLGQFFGASCNQLKDFIELSSPFHFSYQPEPGAKRITFEIELDKLFGTGNLDWSLYVRKGKAVSFKTSLEGFPKVNKYDFVYDGFSAPSGSFEIGEGTEYTLDPEATYYAVLVHRNCPYTRLTLSAFSDDGTVHQAGSSVTGGQGGSSAGKAGGHLAGQGGAAGHKMTGEMGGAGGAGGAGGLPNAANKEAWSLEGGSCSWSAARSPKPPGAFAGLVLGWAVLLHQRRARSKARLLLTEGRRPYPKPLRIFVVTMSSGVTLYMTLTPKLLPVAGPLHDNTVGAGRQDLRNLWMLLALGPYHQHRAGSLTHQYLGNGAQQQPL